MAGICVTVIAGDIERALRGFKKKVMQSGLLREVTGRMFYLKPSEAAKVKRQRAEHRRRKAQAKARSVGR